LAVPLLALVAAGVLAIIATAPVGADDMAKERCGVGGEGNHLNAAFSIERGREFWRYFPAAGKAPELEADDRPMYVVVFDGDYRGPTLSHKVRQGVVCVVNADGDRTIYYDIPRTGYSPPKP
jgi:hypothetical protein